MTSTLMPSVSSSWATASARGTIICVATRVTSAPARLMSAFPNGIRYSPSGTSPFVA